MPEFRKMCPFAPRIAFGSDEYDPQYGAEARMASPCVEEDCMAWRVDAAILANGPVGRCALIPAK